MKLLKQIIISIIMRFIFELKVSINPKLKTNISRYLRGQLFPQYIIL